MYKGKNATLKIYLPVFVFLLVLVGFLVATLILKSFKAPEYLIISLSLSISYETEEVFVIVPPIAARLNPIWELDRLSDTKK